MRCLNMILVGQYDSPFVRRVAVSLRVLGFAYEHDTRSVYGDFDAMRRINPLGRIPSLILNEFCDRQSARRLRTTNSTLTTSAMTSKPVQIAAAVL